MSDEAQRWKDKYFDALEQHEQLEGRWQQRLDLLRRGLVRSSLAAEGSDKAVDQCMQELRELVRSEQMDAGLELLIPRLEKAVLDSEQRRQIRLEQNIQGLHALAQQLLSLSPPREVRKALKKFSQQVEQRAQQSREMPALLAQLSALQAQAIEALEVHEQVRPGLLERLFGSRSSEAEADKAQDAPVLQSSASDSQDSSAPVIQDQIAHEDLLSPAPAVAPSADPASADSPVIASPVPAADDFPVVDDYALPERPEPGYSAVAPHIAQSLMGLLTQLELPSRFQAQAADLRQRIQGGLNWYELVPVLDDLGVLVLALNDSEHHAFADYLQQLNQRLALFIGSLSEAHEGHSAAAEHARSFDQSLREQVTDLHNSMLVADDLSSLKQTVELRLDKLLESVVEHQRQRQGHELDVAERLQSLSARVTEMEHEAQGFRQRIEEQRQMALTDSLTGLPNRAAWEERLELEVARWQRYGGELHLAVLDVDYFKRINDSYGHLAGDKVLKLIAGELLKRVRKTDFLARFGGEEFVLLLPSTPLEGAEILLENLRAGVESCPFHFRGEPVTITLSAGLTAFAQGEEPSSVFDRADQALYRAKSAGRNRVESA